MSKKKSSDVSRQEAIECRRIKGLGEFSDESEDKKIMTMVLGEKVGELDSYLDDLAGDSEYHMAINTIAYYAAEANKRKVLKYLRESCGYVFPQDL